MLRFAVLVVLLVVLLAGCSDGCVTGETRCYGTTVQVCNTKSNWELEGDCAKVDDFGYGQEWVCCYSKIYGIHSCLPTNVCEEVANGGEQ